MTPAYKFNLKETVYLKTDPDQLPRIVTGILIRPSHVVYYLISGIEETGHYDFEITKEKVLTFAYN
jgi:hypothetical protein